MSALSTLRRQRPDCDVAVIGGGPAGAAAAITLARAGHSVVVVEKSSYDERRIGETLPPAARPSLGRLGVWDAFLADGHLPSPGVLAVWGGDEPYEHRFIFNAHGDGWHLDRQRFDAGLMDAARHAGAEVCCGVQIASSRRLAEGGWQLAVISDSPDAAWRRDLHARSVVDATGRAAAFARHQGARRINADRLIGLAGIFDVGARADQPRRDDDAAWTLVEACADGWWYAARLPRGRFIAIYMTDVDLLPRDRQSWRPFWQAQRQGAPHTSAFVPAREPQQNDVHLVAAGSSRLDRVGGPGWLAAGDAATAFDPLSSNGLLHGLTSGMRAGEAVSRHLAGDDSAMRAYQAQADPTFNEYWARRGVYYGRERRWPRSRFWRRRHRQELPASTVPFPSLRT